MKTSFLLTSAILATTVAPALAITDSYQGGVTPSGYTDVVGNTNDFNIFSIDVQRIILGPGAANLKVTVTTNYIPGTLQTNLGDLFFSSTGNLGNVQLDNSLPNYAADTWTADKNRFDYVFALNKNGSATQPGALPSSSSGSGNSLQQNGNGNLIQLLGNGNDVQQSYYSTIGTTSGSNFRNNQAVQYKGSGAASASGTWSLDASTDTLTFLINGENGLLGSTIYVAWAMTCANDVILAKFDGLDLPPPPANQVPLPAGFVLMGTMLLGGGGIAGWRRRRAARAA